MPISRGEFEKGELDPSFLVEEFLRSNPDSAYTVDELIVELASKKMALRTKEMEGILESLQNDKRVVAKMVSDKVHYIYRVPFDMRRS